MIIEEYKAKTIMRESSVSLFSWSEAYLNPYQGCYHDCRYCDGKSEHYYMHDDFGSRIRAKVNAPGLLERFLKRKGFLPGYKEKDSSLTDFFPGSEKSLKSGYRGKFLIYIGGGVCDTYQPAEKELKLSRKLLKVVRNYKFPVTILTKNTNVLRDLDLLKEINEDSHANVNFTITLDDDEKQKILEPGASTTSERFDAVKKLQKEGIHTGIYFYPVLPFLGDSDENMQAIFKKAKAAGAEFVYTWRLTLKPGRSKDEFLNTIQEHFPVLYPKYKLLYGNNNKYGNYDYSQLKNLGLMLQEIKAYKFNYEYGLPITANRYIPEGRVESNLKIAEIFIKIAYLKSSLIRGQNDSNEANDLYRAASYLDKLPEDIFNKSREDFTRLPLAKSVHQYIIEYFLHQKIKAVKELEKIAYQSVLNRIERNRVQSAVDCLSKRYQDKLQ